VKSEDTAKINAVPSPLAGEGLRVRGWRCFSFTHPKGLYEL